MTELRTLGPVNGTDQYAADWSLRGANRTVHYEKVLTYEESCALFEKSPNKMARENGVEIPNGSKVVTFSQDERGCFSLDGCLSVDSPLASSVLGFENRVLCSQPRVRGLAVFEMAPDKKPKVISEKNFLELSNTEKLAKKVAKIYDLEGLLFVGYFDYAAERRSSIFVNLPAVAKPFSCWRATKLETGEIVWLCVSMLNGGVFFAKGDEIPKMKELPKKFGCGAIRFVKESQHRWHAR